jgi:hypothetical protein
VTAAEVSVVTVPGCHLCADALRVVGEVCDPAGVPWREVDLFGLDDAAVARWRDFVPVVLVGDEVVDTLVVDRDRLAETVAPAERGRAIRRGRG